MTITDIYKKYEIMPTLQQHMIRVGAVAKMVCKATSLPLSIDDVVKACLLHDMGNIIKFDLGLFPEFLQPEGKEYWQGVQNDFFARYGFDEHQATLFILKELKVNSEVFNLVKYIGFNEFMQETDLSKPWYALWVCEYADMRVMPTSVVSLEDRITDLENRYGKKYHQPEHIQKRQKFQRLMREIEKRLFENASLTPDDIAEHSIQKETDELWNLSF